MFPASMEGWSPEMQWLLACARSLHSGETSPPALPSIRADVLLQDAATHGLTAVLHRGSQKLPALLAPDIRQRLETTHRANVQHGLRLAALLTRVMDTLRTSGVNALAYKGPALSAQLFGDPAFRAAIDLDVLVRPADAAQALAALQRQGFLPVRPYPPSALAQLFKYRAEFGLTHEDLLLELQWRLAPKYFSVEFDVERAWKRRTEVVLAGRGLPTLSAEDNLLALCVHGAKHQWEKLKWVLDLDQLVRREPEVLSASLLNEAAGMGVHRIVLVSLALAESLLGTPLSEAVRSALRQDSAAQPLTQEFIRGLQLKSSATGSMHHQIMLALRERASDRFLYRMRLLYQPTESEWDLWALPRGLQGLYYGVRASRVAAKGLWLLFR